MNQMRLFEVRNRRKQGWFYLDNDYLNGYAKIFGPIGTAIYVSLCRHADNDQKCFPAQKLIAEELRIGERTVRSYIDLLVKCHIIEVERAKDEKTKKWVRNTYWLVDKDNWLKPEAIYAAGYVKKPEATDDKSQRQPLPIKETNMKNTNNIAELVNYFFKLKDWADKNKDFYKQQGIVYGRYTKSAKELLKLCENNLDLAKEKLLSIKKWAETKNLDWGIETVIKRWFETKSGQEETVRLNNGVKERFVEGQGWIPVVVKTAK